MYEEHSSFEKPDDETIMIWRFLDFTKFVSLLDEQALFFSSANTFSDPFEGVYPEGNKTLALSAFQGTLPDDRVQVVWEQAQTFLKQIIAMCCWHINQHESAAMWKLYLKSDEGVAIQSTFGRLAMSFSNYLDPKVFIGKVHYMDYKTQILPLEKMVNMNAFDPFLYKRLSFEHERELRAVVMLPVEGDRENPLRTFLAYSGMYVPVDLDILVEKVYVSPTAPVWFNDLIRSVLQKYDLDKEVIQSRLYSGDVG